MAFHNLYIPLAGTSSTKDFRYRPRDPKDIPDLWKIEDHMDIRTHNALTLVHSFRDCVRKADFEKVPGLIFNAVVENGLEFDLCFDKCAKSWMGGNKSPADMSLYRQKLEDEFETRNLIVGAIWNICEEHELKCIEFLKGSSDGVELLAEDMKRKKHQLEYLNKTPFNTLLIQKQARDYSVNPKLYRDLIPGVSDDVHQYMLTPADEIRILGLPTHPAIIGRGILKGLRSAFRSAYGGGDDQNESENASGGGIEGVDNEQTIYRLHVCLEDFLKPTDQMDYDRGAPFVDALLNEDYTS